MTESAEPIVETTAGSFEEGLANGRLLLERHPAVALRQAEMLLRLSPAPPFFALAAQALRRLDRADEAEQAELAGIKASFAMRDLDTAAVLGSEGRQSEAQSAIEAFLARDPDNLLALTMAAEIDMTNWHVDAAEERLLAIHERAPSFLRATMLLVDCYRLQARLGEAMALAQKIVDEKPDNPVALRRLADLLVEGNQHDRAAETYGRLLELDPNQLEVAILHAHQLRMLGRSAEAIAAFRTALEIDAQSGATWWALANYYPSELTEQDEAAIESAAAATPESPRNAGALHIALGLIADRRGAYEQAFHRFSEGKTLRAGLQQDNSLTAAADFEELIGSLNPDRFAAAAGGGFDSDAPIFIIGMPRSGTTLLERILASHSQIEAAGELPIIARLFSAHGAKSNERIAAFTNDELTAIGREYVERSSNYRSTAKPRFIDKMNSNWSRAGAIRMMLPNARIIDLRRDPVDCCWSNFKMMFAEGISAANDLRGLGGLYRDYVRMVDAVDSAAPGGILKVRYEDLVDDVESETRRILDFLGLDYEASCVDFHRSDAAVATPSSEQVRQPVNRKGIGSADPYRQWLGPLIEALGPLAAG